MELILKEDVQNLGFKDDIVNVKNGYGRNYLIPQGLAAMATSSAKKVLAEKGIDASTVKGTGKEGRITKDDAVKAVPSMGSQPANGTRGTERKKMSMLRRKVAERLVAVKSETAMLTTFNEVNMQPIFDLRTQYKEVFKAKHGVGLGFMSFFTLAVVRALKMYMETGTYDLEQIKREANK